MQRLMQRKPSSYRFARARLDLDYLRTCTDNKNEGPVGSWTSYLIGPDIPYPLAAKEE
jgi:hypothetical protein